MKGTKAKQVWVWGALVLALALVVLPTGLAKAADIYKVYVPEVQRGVEPTPDPGWTVQYYNNMELSGSPVLTTYENVEAPAHDWGEGAPAAGVNADYFSAKFTRNVEFAAGNYQLCLSMDDMARLWIDGTLVIDQWSAGSDRGIQTRVWEGYLSAGTHLIVVDYKEFTKEARIRLTWFNKDTYPGWKAEYFNNADLTGDPVLVRNENSITHDWDNGSPDPVVNSDYFSARYTKAVHLTKGGMYVFQAMGDDGVRVWIDSWTNPSTASLDHWVGNPSTTFSNVEILPEGWYLITVEYHEFTQGAEFAYSHTYGATSYGYAAEYYANSNLEGTPVLTRTEYLEPQSGYDIELTWQNGSPAPEVPADYFSARWTHTLELAPGSYHFRAHMDDGCRIYVDGRLILDAWTGHSMDWAHADAELYGDWHSIVLEYNEIAGDAHITYDWYRN